MFRFDYRPGGAWPSPGPAAAVPEPLSDKEGQQAPQEWADAYAAMIGSLFLDRHPDGKDWHGADDKPPAPALADPWPPEREVAS